MEPLLVEKNVVLGVIILQDMSQACNCLWRNPRVPLRTEHAWRERWNGEEGVEFAAMTGLFDCSHVWSRPVLGLGSEEGDGAS
jgi:hypothetical protein